MMTAQRFPARVGAVSHRRQYPDDTGVTKRVNGALLMPLMLVAGDRY